MKTLLFALMLFPSLAQAGVLRCQVNPNYSRFWIRSDDKSVSVEVENPRGFKAMPQIEAPFSQENIAMLELQSKELEGLGDRFVYRWDRSQCEFSKENAWLISCHGRVKAEDDNGVNAMSFTTAQIDESSLSGKFSVLRLRFIFEKSSMYFAALPFPLSECKRED